MWNILKAFVVKRYNQRLISASHKFDSCRRHQFCGIGVNGYTRVFQT